MLTAPRCRQEAIRTAITAPCCQRQAIHMLCKGWRAQHEAKLIITDAFGPRGRMVSALYEALFRQQPVLSKIEKPFSAENAFY